MITIRRRLLLSAASIVLSLPMFTHAAYASSSDLTAILDAQPDLVKSRYQFRHPKETLEFFGIEPGMKVVEALPGGGWYSKILLPYLGKEGELMGADYDKSLYPLFGFFSEEQLKAKETWAQDWVKDASTWGGENRAALSAFTLDELPWEKRGKADAVLFIRALHNLARFENAEKGEFLADALKTTYEVLRPGGIVGVVQHEAPADAPDEWAQGQNGYLKKEFVIYRFKKAGFHYVGESPVNANPKDQPTADDFVWRLPPSYAGLRDKPEAKKAMKAIGESNRMTLLFRKPPMK